MTLPDILQQVAFNDASKRWYWTAGSGRTGFIAESAISAELAAHQEAMKATLESLTRQFFAGAIDLVEWQTAFALEVKNAALAHAIFAAGGVVNMDASSYGRVGAFLREQYQHLHDLGAGVASGSVSEAQALLRANMYADTSEAAYWNQWAADRPGGDAIAHLPKLPTRPREWTTPCGSNCRCYLQENADGSIDWIDTGDERECDVCPELAAEGPYRP